VNVNNNYTNNVVGNNNNRGWNGHGYWQNNNWHGAHDYWNNHYSNWHHGSWNNWYGHPAAWYGAGLSTGWLASPADAYVYSNPFYAAPSSLVYNTTTPASVSYNYLDYSQPIAQPPVQTPTTYDDSAYTAAYDPGATVGGPPVGGPPAGGNGQIADAAAPAGPPPAPDANDDGAPPEAFQHFANARTAFQANDYSKAIAEVDRAIKLNPSDAAMHEFRALALFAEHKYRDAAAGVYAVLSVGPGWTWDTLRELYPDPKVYTRQLRALEDYSKKNPKAADAHFLLGYQYLVCNYVRQALGQLQQFVDLDPQDKLAPQLIDAFTPRDSAQASAGPPASSSPQGQP
jgi:tetratricopeptide (TPR) repeat protein